MRQARQGLLELRVLRAQLDRRVSLACRGRKAMTALPAQREPPVLRVRKVRSDRKGRKAKQARKVRSDRRDLKGCRDR